MARPLDAYIGDVVLEVVRQATDEGLEQLPFLAAILAHKGRQQRARCLSEAYFSNVLLGGLSHFFGIESVSALRELQLREFRGEIDPAVDEHAQASIVFDLMSNGSEFRWLDEAAGTLPVTRVAELIVGSMALGW